MRAPSVFTRARLNNFPPSGLKDINSDGPYLFSSQLGSNFRVETFAVDNVGVIESFFLQGSVLHQSITLIDGEGISLSSVGVRSTVSDNSVSTFAAARRRLR